MFSLSASDHVGASLVLVECKRYAKDRLVGVDRVRSLYGVVSADTATAGVVVTTSGFSRDAVEFAEKVRYRMSLRDFDDQRSGLVGVDKAATGGLPRTLLRLPVGLVRWAQD